MWQRVPGYGQFWSSTTQSHSLRALRKLQAVPNEIHTLRNRNNFFAVVAAPPQSLNLVLHKLVARQINNMSRQLLAVRHIVVFQKRRTLRKGKWSNCDWATSTASVLPKSRSQPIAFSDCSLADIQHGKVQKCGGEQ